MNEYSKELMHMTDAEKADYNREYYRKHRQYWVDYANTGHGIGRQASPDTSSDAFPHARKKTTSKRPTTGGNKWGTGLGTGKVGPENSGFPRRPKSKEGVQAYNRAKMDLMTKGQHYGDSNREQKARVYKGIAEAQAQMHSNPYSGSRTPASSVTKSKSRDAGSDFVKRRFGR